MTFEEKFESWKEHADRDLDAACGMYESGRWFYVAFCCQQAVEKLAKGLYLLHLGENAPKIHNVKAIVSCFEEYIANGIPAKYQTYSETISHNFFLAAVLDSFAQSRGKASATLPLRKNWFDKVSEQGLSCNI